MLAAGAGHGDLGRVGGQAGQDGGQVGGGVEAPGTGGGSRAPGGQLVEGPLGVRGVQLLLRDVQRAAVQHGGADVAAEALQVGQAQRHAVGHPVEVDLVIPQRLADLVQVADRGGGGVVARVPARRGQAAAGRSLDRGRAGQPVLKPGQVCSPDPGVPRCSTKTRSMVWFGCRNACAAQVMPLSTAPPNPRLSPFHPPRTNRGAAG